MNPDYSASRHAHHDHDQDVSSQPQEAMTTKQEPERGLRPLLEPEIPNPDLSFDISSFVKPSNEQDNEKIEKRRSNLLKLNEENERLQRELKMMSERLEAAERKRAQLQAKEQERPE